MSWWIEKYGRTLDAFWPVADTKIGRLGIMMAMEGNYPENGRGLAMNGAAEYKEEVIDKQIALMQERDIWKAPSK